MLLILYFLTSLYCDGPTPKFNLWYFTWKDRCDKRWHSLCPCTPEFSGKNSWMYVSFWSCQIFREKNPTWTELTCFQEFNFNNQGLTEVLKLDNLGLTVKGMSKLSLNLWQDEKNTQLTPVYLSTWFVCQQSWIRNQLITQCI